ncbi:MAG: hypothetical protein DCF32_07810 [Leptolyngbya sp.]|nr:MAG: hypothetical protein DCF32_07810 [Leptolyngbya sp.]
MLGATFNSIAIAALPIVGAIAAELVRIFGTRLKEDLNPAIAFLRPYYSVIDAAMAIASPDLRERIGKNPVGYLAVELLLEEGEDLAPYDITDAATWAARLFDFNIYERFKITQASPETRELASKVVNRLSDRLLSQDG